MTREIDEGRKPKPSIKYDYDVERWFPDIKRWKIVATYRSAAPAKEHEERIKAAGGVGARVQKTLRLTVDDNQKRMF